MKEDTKLDKFVMGLNDLMNLAKDDYRRWSEMGSKYDGNSDSRKAIRDDMIDEYNRSMSYTTGPKYIRIISNKSVWGFVVRIHNDKKFRYGDILKPAGWKTPARNFARGNIVDGNYGNVSWTGAG